MVFNRDVRDFLTLAVLRMHFVDGDYRQFLNLLNFMRGINQAHFFALIQENAFVH